MHRVSQNAVIKEEFDGILVTELADWNPIDDSICVPSSSGIAQQSTPPQDSQSVSILNDLPLKISPANKSNCQSRNDGNTCPRDAFVHDKPKLDQDRLRRLRSTIKSRVNIKNSSTINTIKVTSNGSRVQKKIKNEVISPALNLKLIQIQNSHKNELKQLEDKFNLKNQQHQQLLAEIRSENEAVHKNYDALQIEYSEFKFNSNQSLENMHESVSRLMNEQQLLNGQNDDYRQQLQDIISDKEAVQKKYEDLLLECREFKANANKSTEENEKLHNELNQLKNCNQRLSSELENCCKQVADVNDARAALQIEFDVLQMEHSELSSDTNKLLEEKNEQIKALQSKLDFLLLKTTSSQNVSVSEDVNPSADNHSDVSIAQIESNQNFEECNDRLIKKRKQSSLTTASGLTKKVKEDIDNSVEEHETERRMKIIVLNCTELYCAAEIGSLYEFYYHLKNVHGLAPHRCVDRDCTEVFNNISQLDEHMNAIHRHTAQLHLNYNSKSASVYLNWYLNQMTGQFQCNACNAVTNTREKMIDHLMNKCSIEQLQHNALAGQ